MTDMETVVHDCIETTETVHASRPDLKEEPLEKADHWEQFYYSKFCTTTQAVFGPEVKDHNVKAFFRKICNRLDGRTEWCEIFGCFVRESDAMSSQLKEENVIFLASKKEQITHAVVKKQDGIKGIVKGPHPDFTVTSSQKGVLTIFNNQVILTQTNFFIIPLGSHEAFSDLVKLLNSVANRGRFLEWDIQTLSLLQVFHDNQGSPGEMETFAMVFDKDRGTLITGMLLQLMCESMPLLECDFLYDYIQLKLSMGIRESRYKESIYKSIYTKSIYSHSSHRVQVQDIYPLTRTIQDRRQVPQTHEKSINVQVYNRAFHQILTICSDTNNYCLIFSVWDLETGYQIEDACGLNTEVTCAAIEINVFYLATGACDGTVKIWEFESGQEVKALPLSQHSKDEWCLLKTVYPNANESQHALLVLQSGKLKIIQGNSVQTYLYVTWVPEAVSFPRRNPVVSLSLKPDALQTHDFFSQYLAANFVPSVEIKCFDVLKAEGCSLIATGSANGAIVLWDFECASCYVLSVHSKAVLKIVEKMYDHLCSKAEETTRSKNIQYLKTNVQLSKAVAGHLPILASAHENGCIYLWSIQGNLVKELLPFSKYPLVPLTALCTDMSTRMLLAGSKEGHIMHWSIASFLEDPQNSKNQIKEELCWRAHSTEVIEFHEEEKNMVVTASSDGSVSLWHAMNGYDLGYFGQPRKFELSDINWLILPCDVINFPTVIIEESKHMEKKKFEYPVMLDRDKSIRSFLSCVYGWKSLTRSPSVLKKPKHLDMIQDLKFFKALASPKIHRQPLESFEFGNRDTGTVFGSLPIYE
ncbi:LOW QUALITY PROTEIN: WD repeat-containing protein 64 [Cariama cristata]